MAKLALDIATVDKRDIDIVGKYAAHLGELSRIGIPIAEGFVVTTNCFKEFLIENKITSTATTEKQVIHAAIPKEMISQIHKVYESLDHPFKESRVIVTPSSPFSLKDIHYEVKGDANLILKIKEIWATQFERVTLLETKAQDFANLSRLDIAIVVQKKVNLKKSGTIFTQDPLTSDKTKIIIEQDEHEHSRYIVSKRDLKILFKSHQTQVKKSQMISHDQVRTLSHLAMLLQKHFYFPLEIKFSIDKNIIYILKVEPMTHAISKTSEKSQNALKPTWTHHPEHKKHILLKGVRTYPGITTGPVRVFKNYRTIHSVNPSEILVVPRIETSLFPIIKRAKGLITESASFTDHDKMIYGKFVGKPIIQGAKNATIILHTGNVVTLNGANGEIHKGGLN